MRIRNALVMIMNALVTIGNFLKLVSTKMAIACAGLVPAFILIKEPTEPIPANYALLGSFFGYFLITRVLNVFALGEYQINGKVYSLLNSTVKYDFKVWLLITSVVPSMFVVPIIHASTVSYERAFNTPYLSDAETTFLTIAVALMMVFAMFGDIIAIAKRLKYVPDEGVSLKDGDSLKAFKGLFKMIGKGVCDALINKNGG
jgi:hypothetical protein